MRQRQSEWFGAPEPGKRLSEAILSYVSSLAFMCGA